MLSNNDELYNLLYLVIFSLNMFFLIFFNKKNTPSKRLIVVLEALSIVIYFFYSVSKLNDEEQITAFVVGYFISLMLIAIFFICLLRIFIYIVDGK